MFPRVVDRVGLLKGHPKDTKFSVASISLVHHWNSEYGLYHRKPLVLGSGNICDSGSEPEHMLGLEQSATSMEVEDLNEPPSLQLCFGDVTVLNGMHIPFCSDCDL